MGNLYRNFILARDKELQLKQQFADIENLYKQAYAQKRDKALVYYTESRRREIYEQAKRSGFSVQILEQMEYFLISEHWNQDEIDPSVGTKEIDAAELFYKAEMFLNYNHPKKSLGGLIFDAVSSLGNHMDNNNMNMDKEDNTNDN